MFDNIENEESLLNKCGTHHFRNVFPNPEQTFTASIKSPWAWVNEKKLL
jgi:hypothetical protein